MSVFIRLSFFPIWYYSCTKHPSLVVVVGNNVSAFPPPPVENLINDDGDWRNDNNGGITGALAVAVQL